MIKTVLYLFHTLLLFCGAVLSWHSAAGEQEMWGKLRTAMPGESMNTAVAYCLSRLLPFFKAVACWTHTEDGYASLFI